MRKKTRWTLPWLLCALATSPARGEELLPVGAQPPRPIVARSVGTPLVDALPPVPGVNERLEEIRRRIEGALEYPATAQRRGLSGTVEIEFEIAPDGRAHNIDVARSSGHAVLDRAAERGVVRAGVLPQVYGRLAVPLHFELTEQR